jgi:hypothetical protein
MGMVKRAWLFEMTKDELIAKQQLEIEHLKLRLKWAREDKSEIAKILTCIGGGLNDNLLRYDRTQKAELYEILILAQNEDHEEIIESKD